jgi:cytochrome c-type biogenesis protein CcsB
LLAEQSLFFLVICFYALAFLFYILYLFSPRILGRGKLAFWVLLAGALLHTALIIFRFIEAKYPPFQTLYESLSWFAFSAVVSFLIVAWRRDVHLPGFMATGIALAACMYALFGKSPEIKPLFPALQSGWFVWHVVVAFASYAIFVVAFSVEVVFLALTVKSKNGRGARYGLDEQKRNLFHRMAYNLILFGFPLLTFGIVSGAAWAQEAWGRYWGWDPKETWSLITWSVYALYLHAKVTPRWARTKASVLNLVGFVCMIFTFVGVNWLVTLLHLPSLHAYTF